MGKVHVEVVEKALFPPWSRYEKKSAWITHGYSVANSQFPKSEEVSEIGSFRIDEITPTTTRIQYTPSQHAAITIADAKGGDMSHIGGFYLNPEWNASVLLVNRRALRQVTFSVAEKSPQGKP